MAVSAQDLYRELQKLRKKPIEMNQKRKKKIVCQIEEEIFILYLLPSLFGNLFFSLYTEAPPFSSPGKYI